MISENPLPAAFIDGPYEGRLICVSGTTLEVHVNNFITYSPKEGRPPSYKPSETITYTEYTVKYYRNSVGSLVSVFSSTEENTPVNYYLRKINGLPTRKWRLFGPDKIVHLPETKIKFVSYGAFEYRPLVLLGATPIPLLVPVNMTNTEIFGYYTGTSLRELASWMEE